MTEPAVSQTGALRRTLGGVDLTLITMGCVIGSGIFLVPGGVLDQTGGSIGVALSVWVVGGLLSLLGAFTYAELGAMRPEAGGLYSYIRDAFGPLPAFLYGWSSFGVIASGSIAALAVAFASYLGQFISLGPVATKVVAVIVIAALTLINIRGTRESANVQNLTTAAKVAGLVLLSLGLIVFGKGGLSMGSVWPAEMTGDVWSGAGLAMIGVLWAYEGWQYVTFSAGETINPQRVFPRAIALATFILVVLYVLANVGYLAALGPDAVAKSTRVAADATAATLGPTAAKALTVLVLVSIFSAANGLMLTTPRLYYAMARDGVFFARLGQVHARFGTPIFAIVSLSAWSAILALSGTFTQLLTFVVFAGWIFYGLGAMAIFVYRKREPDAPRPFRTPGYPVSPALFVLSAAALVVNTFVGQPGRAAIGLGIVLLGAPAYFLWARPRKLASARAASQ